MKALIFDSGPLISFALNSMLDIIPFLKKKYKGNFYICNAVRKEIIDQPSKSKKFAFEALRIEHLLEKGDLELFDTTSYSQETDIITELANSIFSIRDRSLRILNAGELDVLVLAKNINADAIVVDERTTRLLLENPYRLHKMLEKKFNSNVFINKEKLKEFEKHFSTLKIIRSVELALVGVDYGFFNDFVRHQSSYELVWALLWALKLNGCAISEREIKSLVKLYK